MAVKGPFEFYKYWIGLSSDVVDNPSLGDRIFYTDETKWYIYNGSTWSGLPTTSGTTPDPDPELTYYAITNPAINAAVTTAIIDNYSGVVITTTTTGNAQTLQPPTDTVTQKTFTVINNDTSTNSIRVNGISLAVADAQMFFWDSTAWEAISSVYATTSSDGVVRLSTAALAVTGTNTTRVITPSTLTSRLASPGTIGGTTPGAATFTTLGATTGNITTVNATTVNATTFDTNVAAAGVTLSGTTLSADGTDAAINIAITPKGTGEVDITKVDIDGGTIDGTTIGGSSAAVGTFTTANATTFDTNVAAAGVTLSGTTLAADGTDSNIDINITPKGSGVVKAGTIEVVTTTGTQTLTNKTSKFVTVDGSTSGALSATNVSGTVVSNYGQAASNVALTLPTAAAGYSFVAVVGTTQGSNTWKFTADTNDKIYLDGTAGTDNQSVIVTPAVGNYITFMTFQTGSSAYDWLARTGSGSWSAGA